jgi:RNA-directed DNA polymerase
MPGGFGATADIARWINPKVRGWMTYYGAFCRSELYPLLRRINTHLMRWLMNKYKSPGNRAPPAGRVG